MAGLVPYGLDPAISIGCLLTGIASFPSYVRVAGTGPAMTGLESQSFRRFVSVVHQLDIIRLAPCEGVASVVRRFEVIPPLRCIAGMQQILETSVCSAPPEVVLDRIGVIRLLLIGEGQHEAAAGVEIILVRHGGVAIGGVKGVWRTVRIVRVEGVRLPIDPSGVERNIRTALNTGCRCSRTRIFTQFHGVDGDAFGRIHPRTSARWGAHQFGADLDCGKVAVSLVSHATAPVVRCQANPRSATYRLASSGPPTMM